MKYALWGALCFIGFSGKMASASLPLDVDVNFQKYTSEKSAWGFLDDTSTSSQAWKHVFLFGSDEKSRETLAKLNPALNYCCTMNDWNQAEGPTTGMKEIHASGITCREYPLGTHSVVHEANSGCHFREY